MSDVRIYPTFETETELTADGFKVSVRVRLSKQEVERQASAILDACLHGRLVLVRDDRSDAEINPVPVESLDGA